MKQSLVTVYHRYLSSTSTIVRHSLLAHRPTSFHMAKSDSFGTSSHQNKMATLETLNFDSEALRSLPVDNETVNRIRTVKGACYARVTPTPVVNPKTVIYSSSALKLIDLPEAEIKRSDFAEYFSGNLLLPGSETAAHCYCGHQFGSFAGQLGDGAAIYLGEIVNSLNERWEVQLKGAGKTPFSRTADGRKVLRSSIREFLCSEAMHNLGIPTTRAGCCIVSDSTVVRDIFYNGHPILEKCSIVCRIAPSFIRFGSFQICKGPDRETGREGPSAGQPHMIERLADYVIRVYYPEIWIEHHEKDKEKMYSQFFKTVVLKTANLVAQWQCVGWCHGVLNTDNMSILGLTIDYGPYGFMDKHDPNHICNASDDGGRYAYNKQPEICKWNCLKLAEALQVLVPMEQLMPHLESYDDEYERCYLEKMRKKLGFLTRHTSADKEIIDQFFETMHKSGADFTNSFRCLSHLTLPGSENFEERLSQTKEKLLEQCCSLEEQMATCQPRMDPRELGMLIQIMQTDPALLAHVGKGYRQVAVELERIERFTELKKKTEMEKNADDSKLWDDWLRTYVDRLKLEVSEIIDVGIDAMNRDRVETMNSNNPKFILRNYITQNAIEAAENGDYTELWRVFKLLENPYSDDTSVDSIEPENVDLQEASGDVEEASSSTSRCRISYFDKPPKWATQLKVT